MNILLCGFSLSLLAVQFIFEGRFLNTCSVLAILVTFQTDFKFYYVLMILRSNICAPSCICIVSSGSKISILYSRNGDGSRCLHCTTMLFSTYKVLSRTPKKKKSVHLYDTLIILSNLKKICVPLDSSVILLTIHFIHITK